MNSLVKSMIGTGITGLIVIMALHGAAFVEAMNAAWLFLLKAADDAPLGLSSFFLAMALAIASQPFLRKWLPAMPCRQSREFLVESTALVIGVAVMWLQLHTLYGLLLGLLAGLVAPYIQKGFAAAIALAYRAYVGKPDAPA